ncbi:MAG: nucleotidyltransferase domain-containing protein [Candidatus Kariarchaeaceae archaeon]
MIIKDNKLGITQLEIYHNALESFLEQIHEDKSIIAAILFGSLVDGDVWEKSDIDITLITSDEQTPYKNYWLMDDAFDRSIQVTVYSRNQFKREIEKSLHGSSMLHVITTSKILFSKDETITEYYEDALSLGNRDLELQLLSIVTMVIGDLEKAEKFLYYKHDVAQSYLFIIRLLDRLAQIIVLLNQEIPGREVIDQAKKYEADLINSIYDRVILDKIDEDKLKLILELIRNYLVKYTSPIFRPVIQFLSDEGEVRNNSDISHYLNKMMPSTWWEIAVDGIGNWLAEQGIVFKVPCPVRLTKRSRIEVDETGYFFVGGDL